MEHWACVMCRLGLVCCADFMSPEVLFVLFFVVLWLSLGWSSPLYNSVNEWAVLRSQKKYCANGFLMSLLTFDLLGLAKLSHFLPKKHSCRSNRIHCVYILLDCSLFFLLLLLGTFSRQKDWPLCLKG